MNRFVRPVGVAVVILLQVGWWMQPEPLAARAIIAAFLGLSLFNPAFGLLALAGLGPFSTVLAELCALPLGGTRLLEQMVLACITGALMRSSGPSAVSRIAAPGALMAVVALSSAFSLVPARTAPVPPEVGGTFALVRDFLHGTYAASDAVWAPLVAALVVLECVLLGWAVEREVRRTPELAARLLFMALIGQAGAAVLDLYRIAAAAMRSGEFLATFPSRLARARVSMQTDVNAAASGLLLVLVGSVGLIRGTVGRRFLVSGLVALALLGLWITGSRAGLVAGLLAIAFAAAYVAFRSGGARRTLAVGVVALMIAGGIWLVAAYPRGRNPTVEHSIESRLLLLRGGGRMFLSAPVFGVGIAQFFGLSESVVGAELQRYQQTRENAHNNFVQVLAEQGALGFAGLLGVLGIVVVGAMRAEHRTRTPLRFWLGVGACASILTWMTGHPLLVPEYAYLFWVMLGLLAALTPAAPRPQWSRAILVASVLIVLTVPIRARQARDQVDLEHLGFGLSQWSHDDSERYRTPESSFTLFLPSAAPPNILPVRRAPGVTVPVTIELRRDGVIVARLTLDDDVWHPWEVHVPSGPRRFEELSGRVTAEGASAPPLVRLGKDHLSQ